MSKRLGVLLLLVMPVGCGVGEGTGSTPPWAQPETPIAPAADQDDAQHNADTRMPTTVEPYQVRLQTSKGDVVIDVHPEWAPIGASRFHELVSAGYYDGNRIFRVVPEFVVQFGMHGDPTVNAEWDGKPVPDDSVVTSNKRGRVTFATSGPNARTAQVFINLNDNPNLDTMPGSFAPFGEVVEGMEIVDAFNSEYGEAPSNRQPEIAEGGNEFLDAEFPNLDSIIKATIVSSDPAPTQPAPADSAEQKSAEGAPSEQKAMPAESEGQAAPEKEPAEKESTQKPAPEKDSDAKDAPEKQAKESAEEKPAETSADKDADAKEVPEKESAPAEDAGTKKPAEEASPEDASNAEQPQ